MCLIGLGLIAGALGYLVFVTASKEQGGVKLLGQVIGIAVMIAAFLTVAYGGQKFITGKYCPKHHHLVSKIYCPLAAKSAEVGEAK